jgi:class 3 adenylate cyclase
MNRQSSVASASAKKRRREKVPKRDKRPKVVRSLPPRTEAERLRRELRESLQQQAATADVLKVISRSTFDLKLVLEALIKSATRLCGATRGHILQFNGEFLIFAAAYGAWPRFTEYLKDHPFRPGPGTIAGRAAAERRIVHVHDVLQDPGYQVADLVKQQGYRTVLAVPMLREEALLGVIAILKTNIEPFTEKQIELVATFANQAVIAIENARLLNELRQRTDDLSESLEQQTATSEVLRVISGSPTDIRPVLDAVGQNAARLCEATNAVIFHLEDGLLRQVAAYGHLGTSSHPSQGLPIDRETVTGRAVFERRTIHVHDLAAEESEYPQGSKHARIDGHRTTLASPMLREGAPVGAILIRRTEVRPFSQKQIHLVTTFADQAAIAIENVRLFNELNKLNQQLEHRVADQVGEIERMGRLRRFLPPQVADLIVASGNEKQLESHRREITALFCDLRGFTGFSESSDPEDVMALLRDYHAAIGQIIIKYSGTLERYAGDGVMVVFNDPVPVDNPALQAVLMALEMRQAIAALTETWRRWGHDIGFGIGIAHGFATLGTIGFEGRFDYAAIGTVSNVASRLCDEAKSGQILISPRVLTKVETAVTVEPVGEFALKGIRRPMMAYNVLEALASKPS